MNAATAPAGPAAGLLTGAGVAACIAARPERGLLIPADGQDQPAAGTAPAGPEPQTARPE
jgi:hypothetical protein